jgi:acyl-CoA synthetase (AMP-forming)/AMP-acid ligase II
MSDALPTAEVRYHTCLGDAVDAAAAQFGDQIGWVFETEAYSFEAMRAAADATARALLRCGVREGDVVATWMANRPEFATLQFACAKIGAILAPMNTRFRSAEANFILGHSEARVLVYSPRFLKTDYRALLSEAAGPITGAPDALSCERLPSLRHIVELGAETSPWALSWSQFLAAGDEISAGIVQERQRSRSAAEPLMLQYTSGTTAFPKGALLSHTLVLNYAVQVFARMGVKQGDAVLNTQPFYHSGGACGTLPIPLSLGCKMLIPEYYEPERMFRWIARERPIARTGFGTMYLRELDHPAFGAYDLSSVRVGWCVAPRQVLERVRTMTGIELIQIYGSTEAAGTAGDITDPWEIRAATQGKPFEGTEIEIRDPVDHRPLPNGTVGEIWMRGWGQMSGYLKQPEQTGKVLDRGWTSTGDLGSLDTDGYLRFAGRIKDMLKPGGENVSAEEVESFLLTHQAIRQVAVIGVPDDDLGEAVLAVVETYPGRQVTAADIVAFCRNRIAGYKVPRHVVFTDDWPTTESGKILKTALRDRYAAASATPAAGPAELQGRAAGA